MWKLILILFLSIGLILWILINLPYPQFGNKTIIINGEKTNVPRYGLFNPSDKQDNIAYRVSIRNVVWGCLLVETVFMPVIIFGWNVYEPIGKK